MQKLIKPSEYAKKLGISRQAVYAKIKKGALRSKSLDGKLYIVVDTSKSPETSQHNDNAKVHFGPDATQCRDYKALLSAKDETIEVLKSTIKDLKESNRQISTTLRGEIDLLKEAFYEMRTLYMQQLEQKKVKRELNAIEVISDDATKRRHSDLNSSEDLRWVGVKKFFKHFDVDKKKNRILKRLKKAQKRGDKRVTTIDGKLKMDLTQNYEDILYK